MSVRDVKIGSGEALEALRQQMQEASKPVATAQPQQQETFKQVGDPNRNARLADQFVRGKLSVGNSMIQRQLSAQLAQRASLKQPAGYSREVLGQYMKNISNAAQKTTALRQIQTEQSLSTVKDIVNNGKDTDRMQAGNVLEKTDSALQESPILETINKVLDTFNDLIKMLTEMIKALNGNGANTQPTPNPTPNPAPVPTPAPAPTPAPTSGLGAQEARTRLVDMGFSQTTAKKLSDTSATKTAGLSDEVLKSVGKQNLTLEQEFAGKIDALPKDAYDKLKSLPGAEQVKLSTLSLQDMIAALKGSSPAPTPTPGPTPTPTPTPVPGPTPAPGSDARTKLHDLGFSLTTIKKLSDKTVDRLVQLDTNLIKETGKKNATMEQIFAKKVGDLPDDAFATLKALSGAEQTRITGLSYQDMLNALKNIPTPTPTPTPTPDPGGVLGPEKVRLNSMTETGPAPLVKAINSAKESVDVSIYLFTSPSVTQALKDAAARGVKVRVMMEPEVVGIKDANKAKADELRAAGIEVEDTPPQFSEGNKVDHAKFMLIDNKELLFGTGNLVRSGLGEADPNSTSPQHFNRDFWVEDTRAESIKEAHALFDADWSRQSTTGVDFKNLVVTPDNASQKILDFIDGAKTTLSVYNQSINDPTIIQHLIAAKQRGVDVKVIVNAPRSDTDKNIQTHDQLTAAGIPTGYMREFTLHAKAMVADNKAYIGSQNFTGGGLYNNREFGEIVDDKGVVGQLSDIFNKDFKKTGLVAGDPTQAAEQVRLHPMPDSTSYPIIAAINSATKSVDLEVYQLTDSGVTDALKLAAARGVQVRVMLEPKPVGGTGNFDAKAAELRAAGVTVKETPPEFDSDFNVDHAKFMVIDGRDLLFGTGNLVKSGLGGGFKPEYNNRDFWVEDTRSTSVNEASTLFQRDWDRQSTKDINFKNIVVTPDNSNTKIIDFIDSAKSKLYIYNQELYDQNVIDHIVAAKQRGVDVHVLLGSQASDTGTGPNSNKAALAKLQAAGIPSQFFTKNYLHAKAIVADDKAFIGSQNFSTTALTKNREFGEIFSQKNIVDQLTKMFLADEANPGPAPTPAPDPTDG